ncbi:helix-turn-helix transcriptional regulator [Nocardia stercoris]|uniref:XRE family transcriptional regulator n=1 Tax=Nocardia stercoris TaxID=2483361 RepID=A0A3M2L639_9NOCA|nr:helix-turn-helix transcriptional regulator [Nocardia stercoris]RMI32997.1 XRE family transcriptional regulator [Nocardia stercoris]
MVVEGLNAGSTSGSSESRKVRRAELGAFLRSRRARITPEEMGLPTGSRRRTPGLRREEVAQLAGVGVTWYTWLEQGRDINASMQVLDAIARTLALDPVEKAHLYRLADVPTIGTGWGEEESIPGELQGILDHLHPLPAVLMSARYDVLAHNLAYEVLFPTMSGPDSNVLRSVFLTPDCCNPYPNCAERLARMVGYLRAAYVKHLEDPSWNEFIADLQQRSPLFAEMWSRNDVGAPPGRFRTIRNLAVGDFEVVMTSMTVPSIAGAWFQVLTPAGETAQAQLTQLLAMSEEQRQAPAREHRDRHHRRTA